jgi:hypothetical protein
MSLFSFGFSEVLENLPEDLEDYYDNYESAPFIYLTLVGCIGCGEQPSYYEIRKEIRNNIPIAAEYCILKSIKKDIYGEQEVRLTNILDTTKFYPYEYRDLRNCTWNDKPSFSLIYVPRHLLDDIIDAHSVKNKGYKDSDVPKTAKTVTDYHAVLKDKFYIGLKYQKVWSGKIFKERELKLLPRYYTSEELMEPLDSNYIGVATVLWELSDVCVSRQKEKRENDIYYSIGGEYSIRITGKCTKADMKKLQEMGSLDYPPEEGDVILK